MRRVSIILSYDPGFLRPACVAACSAVECLPESVGVDLWLITANVEDETVHCCREFLKQKQDRHQVHAVHLQNKDIAALRIPKFGENFKLGRLLIGQLPLDTERAIYLDCVTYTRRSLWPLMICDLENKPVAAVPNRFDKYFSPLLLPLTRGQSQGGPSTIFNSGVLVIDVKRWRDQAIGERALAFLSKHIDICSFRDQDSLNVVLEGNWKKLD